MKLASLQKLSAAFDPATLGFGLKEFSSTFYASLTEFIYIPYQILLGNVATNSKYRRGMYGRFMG